MDELERRRLEAEGWSKKSIAHYERFGHRSALYLSLIDVPNSVITPKGQGTLINALCGEARVQLVRGKAVKFTESSKAVKPTEVFSLDDVKPINSERKSA